MNDDEPVTVTFSVRMTTTRNVSTDIGHALQFLAQKYIEAGQDWQAMTRNPAIKVNVLHDNDNLWEQPTLWDE